MAKLKKIIYHKNFNEKIKKIII
ncbi:hypothetical protein HZS_5993 [Henneguya salminicola]|nr:hypothetical protein HZS_5993 [Henneguya salminicola]